MPINPAQEYSTLVDGTRVDSTMDKPANTVDGDILLSALQVSGTTAVSLPAGWNLIIDIVNTWYAHHCVIAYKVASSEGANWTWTHTSERTLGWVQRFSNVNTSPVEDCTRSTLTDNNTTPLSVPEITTVTAGACVCLIATAYFGRGPVVSSNITQRIEVSVSLYLFADIQASAGGSGAKTVTFTSDGDQVAVLLALRPMAGGTPLSVNIAVDMIDWDG